MSGFLNQTFDDRDTDHLRYQGGWFLTGSWNASNVGESGTLSSTSDLNANVTFTFPTPAMAFYYYGIPRCCGGFYGICIDCDPNNPNFLPIDAVNTTDDGKNPPVVLFSMTFKTPGIHEIIIRNQNDTRFGKSQITIDRIDLEVVNENATPSTAPPSSTTPTNTGQPRSSSTSSSSTPIGAIVGGVLGASAVFLGIFIFALWLRLRRKRAALADDNLPPPSIPPPMPPQPLIPSTPATSSLLSMHQANSATAATFTPNRPHSARYGHATGKRQPPLFTSVSSFSDATSTSPPTSEPSRPPRRELDGGPLPIDEDDVLPPEYGQVFAGRRASARSPPSAAGNSSSLSARNSADVPDSQPDSNSPRRRKF
ncbi:hypothetical protein GALMADRAFT_145587 [Galerina marginata CBS 339.88]|uniref:Uncharacterized protein n=1 Tax=Galerina marginata (strain CBS 339.88) TaxID=685588 RepID=A0A067SGN5_GALM3|nr:hypothetical protein GALMADRAFT_145587 [Galerina marginata CBS 339.88]